MCFFRNGRVYRKGRRKKPPDKQQKSDINPTVHRSNGKRRGASTAELIHRYGLYSKQVNRRLRKGNHFVAHGKLQLPNRSSAPSLGGHRRPFMVLSDRRYISSRRHRCNKTSEDSNGRSGTTSGILSPSLHIIIPNAQQISLLPSLLEYSSPSAFDVPILWHNKLQSISPNNRGIIPFHHGPSSPRTIQFFNTHTGRLLCILYKEHQHMLALQNRTDYNSKYFLRQFQHIGTKLTMPNQPSIVSFLITFKSTFQTSYETSSITTPRYISQIGYSIAIVFIPHLQLVTFKKVFVLNHIYVTKSNAINAPLPKKSDEGLSVTSGDNLLSVELLQDFPPSSPIKLLRFNHYHSLVIHPTSPSEISYIQHSK